MLSDGLQTRHDSHVTPTLVKVQCTEALFPGSTGKANLVYYLQPNQGIKALDDEVTIVDYIYSACLLPGEYAWALHHEDSGEFEITSSVGLLRAGVTDGTISYGSSGTVSLHDQDGDTGENVTGYLQWMHGSQDIAASKEVKLEFWPSWNRWVITGSEC